MLIAIALTGLAAAFVAPIFLGSDDADEDTGPVIADDNADDVHVGDLIDELDQELDTPVSEPLDEPPHVSEELNSADDKELFEVRFAEGIYEFEEFNPVTDVVRVHMTSADATVETGMSEDGAPEVLITNPDGDEMALSFPGFADVPVEGVEITVLEGASDTISLMLSEILSRGVQDMSDEAEPDPETLGLDKWDAEEDTILDDPIDDLADLVPLAPGSGDDVDTGTDALDDLVALTAGGGDDVDVPVDPLPDVNPIAPNPGDETEGSAVAPNTA